MHKIFRSATNTKFKKRCKFQGANKYKIALRLQSFGINYLHTEQPSRFYQNWLKSLSTLNKVANKAQLILFSVQI